MSKGIIATLAIEALAVAALLTLALDMRAHNRVEQLGGVNIWGYRGPVMQRKAANEIRIAVIGGDLAFGWGVAASETLAYSVRQLVSLALDLPGRPLHRFTAVDLGATGLTPAEYAGWIQRFAYLRPDVVCVLPDARTHRTANASIQPDRGSAVFRTFGYAPILPLVIHEKGAVMHSALVRGAGSIAATLNSVGSTRPDAEESTGRESAADYIAAIRRAIEAALASGSAVVLVAPPATSADDNAERDALRAMATSAFRDERRFKFVDLGAHPEMSSDPMWLDGVALSAAGHAAGASYVAPDVLSLVQRLIS